MMSTPWITSGFRLDAFINSSYTIAGLRFANVPISLRRPSNPVSGRKCLSSVSHFGPPIAPKRTASHFFTPWIVASGNGTPVSSMAAPPSNISSYLRLNPCVTETASSTFIASSMISGPIPSPLMTPIL